MRRWEPGPKLTPKVLLEGTRLTHKTDLAFGLNEYAPFIGPRKYRYHPPLVSAEWGVHALPVVARADRLRTRGHRGVEEDFDWLEERLAPLGFHVVLCTRRPETFEAARAERLKVSGNPSQYDDLGVFLDEQDVLRRLVAVSRLPVLEVDMSDGDLDGACARIVDWLTETGGLWAPGVEAG